MGIVCGATQYAVNGSRDWTVPGMQAVAVA